MKTPQEILKEQQNNNDLPPIKIDLKETESFVCKNCNNDKFAPIYIIKRISSLLSPTGKEIIIPIQVFACSKCETIPEYFIDKLNSEI